MISSSVDTWLSAILAKDANTFEDAYWGDRPEPNEAVPRIIEKLSVVFDGYTRGKLIELLGECEDLSVLPILEKELTNPEEGMAEWAKAAIEALQRGEKWNKYPKYL